MSCAHAEQCLPLALTLAASAILVPPATAQTWDSIPVNRKINTAYVPPASQELEGVYQAMKDRKNSIVRDVWAPVEDVEEIAPQEAVR
jgi:hypothetical protein